MVGVEVDTMNRSRWCGVGIAALVFVAGLGTLADECTITVQPGESIQAAIDAASPGDVICLAEGEWEENLVIQESLTLRAAEMGSEPQAVINSAREGWPVIRIESEEPIDVTIQGLKITGAFGDCYKEDPEWICAWGISGHGKATVVIENNTIHGNHAGIGMLDSSKATIENNTISDSEAGIGVLDSSEATIDNNIISHNRGYGIGKGQSSRATIENNTISENRDGIWMWGSARATIDNNIISENEHGIMMRESAQATIENNTISENVWHGIWMWDSSRAMIKGNTISDNNWVGIAMGGSQATIEGNTISHSNWVGIEMRDSSQVTITRNVIRDNERYGVALLERPCDDTDMVFTGYATGEGNSGEGNLWGDYCPDELAFLFTEEGGEQDRRE